MNMLENTNARIVAIEEKLKMLAAHVDTQNHTPAATVPNSSQGPRRDFSYDAHAAPDRYVLNGVEEVWAHSAAHLRGAPTGFLVLPDLD